MSVESARPRPWRVAVLAAGMALLLAACATALGPARAPIPVALAIAVDAAWPAAAVRDQIDTATQRLAECGLTIIPDDTAANRLGFVATLGTAAGGTIEGTSFPNDAGGGTAQVAWAGPDGRPLEHKQTAAHELGHVLGLRHTDLHAIDLMAPYGCEVCRFTARQCAVMRAAVSGS